jgi:hypothetical protein
VPKHPLPTVANAAALAVDALRGQAQTVPQLVVAFGRMLKGLGTGEGMVVPFTSPQSVLNGRVREKRRFRHAAVSDGAPAQSRQGRRNAPSMTLCWRSAAVRCVASSKSAATCRRNR